jgi:hypothetical protein
MSLQSLSLRRHGRLILQEFVSSHFCFGRGHSHSFRFSLFLTAKIVTHQFKNQGQALRVSEKISTPAGSIFSAKILDFHDATLFMPYKKAKRKR